MTADKGNTPDRMPIVSGPSPGQARPAATPEIEGYEILHMLGEGGMGIVYLARQKHPIQRRVALKVIKAGMDSKPVIARFEVERQALALLDHPNVARVYEAGTTKDGSPYFSMEYVDGPPVTEYCDRCRLTIEERLRLFIQVCQGVQHAHQKGIIHRDLKPSNVLISTEDGYPLAKIIDFGVAKAVTAPLTERTLFTEQGQLLGTPEYMSPEQAEMAGQDIDTRSDVYSLGVLLYELLTGAQPFEREILKQAGFAEILRIIREEDPPRPSTRLSNLGDGGKQIADNRKASLNLLPRRIRGDLDWIVMKSLEKDRRRRYATATELAADIERHLKSEPVQAGRPTVSYRLRKFVQRHRAGVLASALVVAALIAGLVAATYGFRQAVSQRNRANRSLYSSHMLLARRNWEAGRVVGIPDLLEAHRPHAGAQDLRGWEWYYLKGLCDRALLALNGHAGAIRSVAWSPDGRHVASAGEDFTVRIWDWQEAKAVRVLRLHHQGRSTFAAWSPDGHRLAAGAGGRIGIWNWVRGESLVTMRSSTPMVPSLAWSPDGTRLASVGGGAMKLLHVWNSTTGQEEAVYSDPTMELAAASVAWSPTGQWLAVGMRRGLDSDTAITLWNVATRQQQELGDLQEHGSVNSVAWDPDGRLVASATDRLRIEVWDAATGQKQAILHDHKNRVNSVAWSPDGRHLVSAGQDHTVKIGSWATKEVLATLCGHRGEVYAAAWSPDGRRIVSGGEDGTIRIWDAGRTEEAFSTRRFENWVRSVSWGPDGRRLATACGEPAVEIWDAVTTEKILALEGHRADVSCLAWSPRGERLATGGMDRLVKIWDTASGEELMTLYGHRQEVRSVRFSQDGTRVVSESRGTTTVWDTETGGKLATFGGYSPGSIHEVAVSPTGRRVALPSRQQVYETKGRPGRMSGVKRTIKIWTVKTKAGNDLCAVPWERQEVDSMDWSPDGRRLAMSGGGGGITVWDIPRRRRVFSVQGHAGRVRCLRWSSDGRRLASAGDDGIVQIRETVGGEEVLALHGHEAEVLSLAWSIDGRRLATASADGTVKIWDASGGYALARDADLGAGRRIAYVEEPPMPWRVRAARTAGKPQPASGATVCHKEQAELRWTPAEDAIAQHVYFRAEGDSWALLAKVTTPRVQELPRLEDRQWYYWRVDSEHPDGSITEGAPWRFSTGHLVAWWKLDASNDRRVRETSNDRLSGILVDDACIFRDSARGSVLRLDGDGDFVSCGRRADFDITDSISIAAWIQVRRRFDKPRQAVVTRGDDTTGWRLQRDGKNDGMEFACSLVDGERTYQAAARGDTSVNDGRWHHVIGIYDGDKISLYVDGVLDASEAAPGYISRNTFSLFIGEHGDRHGGEWNGLIDDVCLTSYALTEQEVRELYERTNDGDAK